MKTVPPENSVGNNVRGRINRFEAGPPALRSQRLLTLLDAGAVHVPFGPHPELTASENGQVVIRSTKRAPAA
jgi:hypothetical protein